jgi:hypothetical protein
MHGLLNVKLMPKLIQNGTTAVIPPYTSMEYTVTMLAPKLHVERGPTPFHPSVLVTNNTHPK